MDMSTMTDKIEIGVTLQSDESLSETLKFEDYYTVTKRLRSGSYGIVFVTRHLSSDQDYAVKVIDRMYVVCWEEMLQ